MSEEFGSEFSGDFAAENELRALLSGLDPMSARVPVEPVTSPRARHQLEQIMSQSTEYTETVPSTSRFRGRGKTWLAAAAAVAAIAIGTTVAVGMSDGGQKVNGPAIVAAPKVLPLTAPAGGPASAMCMRFDVAQLSQAAVAFAGTVTAITPQQVTLKVDHWYKGGDADEVTVAAPASDQPNPVLEGGVDYQQGQKFLISATDGTVSSCGYSGPASPDFEKSFEQAFPAAS
jgi:hypothetical protein